MLRQRWEFNCIARPLAPVLRVKEVERFAIYSTNFKAKDTNLELDR